MTDLRVERLKPEESDLWDEFVADSLNGTIFHRRRFLEYHPPERFEDASRLIFRGGRLVALFPAAYGERDGRRILRSHPGSSYGGLVVRESPGAELACRMVDALIEVARWDGCGAIELRRAPRIFESSPCDELDYALHRQGFVVRDQELSTCYDLSRLPGPRPSLDEVASTFSSSAARAMRKACNEGLRVEPVSSPAGFGEFWALLEANLRKHDATPTHSAAELYDLKTRFPDDVQLLAAWDGERMAAGLVAFVANRRAAHVFYFASHPEAQRLRPLNLTVAELVRYAAARDLRFVNFGISTEKGGREPNWGLFRFKESFGGAGTLRSYWVRDLGTDDPSEQDGH